MLTVKELAAAAPEIVAGMGTTLDSTPLLQWTPIAGAAHYDVWVNNLTTGQSGVLRDRTVPQASLTPSTAFTNGHAYLWTVRAVTDDGQPGQWAAHRSFRVSQLSDIAPPSAVGPIGETSDPVPQFVWSELAGAASYDFRLDDVTAGSSRVIDATGIPAPHFASTVALAPGHEYRWSVRAVSERGEAGAWSEYQTFQVIVLVPPAITAPNAIASQLQPTLEWTSVAGAARYEVWANNITTGQQAVFRQSGIVETRFVPDQALQAGHTYVWTVRATTEGGVAGPWAEHRRFLVTTPVGTPVLQAPGSVVNGTITTFRWLPATGAARYDLWVNDATSGRSAVIRESQLTFPSFTPSAMLVPGHRYVWTVRGINAQGVAGDWAPHRTFSVAASAQSAVVGPLPADDADTPWTALADVWDLAFAADFDSLWSETV